MSRKDTVNSLFMMKLGAPNEDAEPQTERDRVRTGAVSAMGMSLQELAQGAKTASLLKEQIASGQVVVELETALVDGSIVSDRLTIDVDPQFQALVASIRDSGQQVPILVRPHPGDAQRYQVAYGHRRLRAAACLGRPVRAVVQTLSDTDLVIAQGKENLDRKDLSYIEKALFARRLEERGFERATIVSALSTDKADLSRYIAVARMIPEAVLEKIGPAPKAGRARWLALAERLAVPEAAQTAQAVFADPDFAALDSDGRFARLFRDVAPPKAKSAPRQRDLTVAGAEGAARIERRRGQTVLVFNEKLLPEFAEFIAGELDDLHRRFAETQK